MCTLFINISYTTTCKTGLILIKLMPWLRALIEFNYTNMSDYIKLNPETVMFKYKLTTVLSVVSCISHVITWPMNKINVIEGKQHARSIHDTSLNSLGYEHNRDMEICCK